MDDRIIEISQLAGGLAHEIRNPLSTLLLNLKLLEEDLGAGLDDRSDTLRRARRKIEIARGEADRLQRMLDEFLLLVRPVGLRQKAANLNLLVERLVEFYAPEAEHRGIVLRAELSGEPVICPLDPPVFQQAVLNLLINAQQAIRGSGEILVRVSAQGDAACLEVVDDGEGMTTEVAEQAMQAFYSTKPGGSGLGLSTTSRIISAHGGRLHLFSKPGEGTRFEIHLPLFREAPNPKT